MSYTFYFELWMMICYNGFEYWGKLIQNYSQHIIIEKVHLVCLDCLICDFWMKMYTSLFVLFCLRNSLRNQLTFWFLKVFMYHADVLFIGYSLRCYLLDTHLGVVYRILINYMYLGTEKYLHNDVPVYHWCFYWSSLRTSINL